MSPDLNPTENLWGELKYAIWEQNPANVQELEKTAKEKNTSCEVQEAYRWLQETFGGCHHISEDSTVILPLYQQKVFPTGVTAAKNVGCKVESYSYTLNKHMENFIS